MCPQKQDFNRPTGQTEKRKTGYIYKEKRVTFTQSLQFAITHPSTSHVLDNLILIKQLCEVDTINNIAILQVRKLRHSKDKWFVCGHMTNIWGTGF